MSASEDIKTEYMSSLADLTFNSKPLINVLTMLAEENLPNAKIIVEAIEEQLAKVGTDVKLPILYLIDCIVKNVGQTYKGLFSQNIVATFCNVFKMVDEKTRLEMFKLRQTWNDVFPQMKLYAIDVQIRQIDPAWPVTAQPSNSIHLNPKFLKNSAPTTTKAKIPGNITETSAPIVPPKATDIDKETLLMQEQLIQKQKELLELQRKTLELEVLQTKVKLQEQMKSGVGSSISTNILLKPEVAKQLIPEAVSKTRPVGINQRPQHNQPKIKPVNSALVATARPIRDPRLLRQQQQQQKSEAITQKPLENNKNITNKARVKDIPNNDPRLSINKIDKKSKIPTKQTPISVEKSSRNVEKSRSSPTFSSSSSSSQDSPTKTNKTRTYSNKHKKRDKPETRRTQDSETPSSKREKLSPKEDTKNSNNDSNFKSVKNKNRNYVRRNLNDSPVQGELASKILENKSKSTSPEPTNITKLSQANKAMDVDLRQNTLSKKRASIEASEQPPKKSRNLDELFGTQDTDMRPLPIPIVVEPEHRATESVEKPPTPPPPPIISTEQPVADVVSSSKSDFDAVRAKLANATNREKILSKSFRKDKLRQEDTPKVTISPEEEKAIKSGQMSHEQSQQILSKLFRQIEKGKLREAQKRDNEHEEKLGNLSLQAISDDEFDIETSSAQTHTIPPPPMPFNDKDERLNLRHMILQPQNMETIPPGIDNIPTQQQQFYPRGGRAPFRGGRGDWRGNRGRMPLPRQPIRPWLHQQGPRWRNFAPQNRDFDDESSKSPNQDVGPQVQLQEDIKTLVIDGMPRDIRIYNDIAVIFLNNDDPREISFQNGSRRVIFNNNESFVLNFGENYKECLVNNFTFRVKLGVPSREIFINDIGFECFFGGPQIHITVNGINLIVSLEGPPPPVKIGDVKRTDLVLGKIDALIDAQLIVPVFLDCKLQKFVLEGRPCTIKFVDALKKVLINDVPYNVEFGALPKPFIIHGKKHFIRFSVLPKGFKPGFVKIKDMEGEPGVSPVREEDNSQDGLLEAGEPLRPENKKLVNMGPNSPDNRSNSPGAFLNNVLPVLNNYDLSKVFSQAQTPAPTTGGYQVQLPSLSTTSSSTIAPQIQPLLNINDLFQKLVASGVVKTQEPTPTTLASNININNEQANKTPPKPEPAKPQKRPLSEILIPVTFLQPKTLKIRQAALYSTLYTGMQCSSCGMRFPPEASMLYSQHLDWHFRQNRRGKKNARIANSRKWYYSLADWKNFEELEDIEEREKNYFDQQQQQAEVADEAEEEQEIPTVPADPGTTNERCHMCRDTFEQFFSEEKEEWHLKNAIKIDNKTYHPVCYQDYNQTILDESKDESQSNLIPGLEIILDDDEDEDQIPAGEIVSLDDDEEIKIPEDAPSPTKDEELPSEEDDGDDDDVILNEVAPIKIIVDDDDDEEPVEMQNDSNSQQQIEVKREKRPVFDDGFVDVGEILTLKDHGQVRIKSEPVDDDEKQPSLDNSHDLTESHEDSHLITEVPHTDQQMTSRPELITSIDGNVELMSTTTASGMPMSTVNAPKIKINISKPLPVITQREKSNSDSSDNSDTIKSGSDVVPIEEQEIVNYKPGLQNVPLRKLPRVQKGSELTGLCSIM